MEKVQKPSNPVCYTPSSEPFIIYHRQNPSESTVIIIILFKPMKFILKQEYKIPWRSWKFSFRYLQIFLLWKATIFPYLQYQITGWYLICMPNWKMNDFVVRIVIYDRIGLLLQNVDCVLIVPHKP
jgi:hypothetical protein